MELREDSACICAVTMFIMKNMNSSLDSVVNRYAMAVRK